MSMWQDVYQTFLESERAARIEQEQTTEPVPKSVHIIVQFEERAAETQTNSKQSLEAHYKALEKLFGPEAVEALRRAITDQQQAAEQSEDDE